MFEISWVLTNVTVVSLLKAILFLPPRAVMTPKAVVRTETQLLPLAYQLLSGCLEPMGWHSQGPAL